MADRLVLNCLILGDDPRNVFHIKIPAMETVGELRDAMKEKIRPAFDHVPVNTMSLWQVSILMDGDFNEQLGKLKFANAESLLPVKRLSSLFSDPPAEEHVHIIVKPPPPSQFSPSPYPFTSQLISYSFIITTNPEGRLY
jgi:hypothetical protein